MPLFFYNYVCHFTCSYNKCSPVFGPVNLFVTMVGLAISTVLSLVLIACLLL